MTLPTSRNESYIDNVTPIPAKTMNDLQDCIIGAKYGLRTAIHSPAAAAALVGFVAQTILAPAALVLEAPASTGSSAWLNIPGLVAGDRVFAVRLIGRAANGAASDFNALLNQITAPSGVAIGSVVTTNPVATLNSAATTNLQTLTMTPASPIVLAATDILVVRMGAAATAGAKTMYRIEVDYDHP